MTTGQTHEESLIVPCSKCGVGIGEHCKWGEGLGRMKACHLRRMIDARQRIESLPPQAASESAGVAYYGNCECAVCSAKLYGKKTFWIPSNSPLAQLRVCESCASPVIAEKTAPIGVCFNGHHHGDHIRTNDCVKWLVRSLVAEKTAPTLPPLDEDIECRIHRLDSLDKTDRTNLAEEVLDNRERQLLASEARNQEIMGLLSMPPLRAYVFTQIGDEAYYKAEDVRRWFDQIKEEHHG